MKVCPNCKKVFKTEDELCPLCGEKLIEGQGDAERDKDELSEEELVAVMTALGLL